MTGPSYDVVVPTLGRPSLRGLLEALAKTRGPRPGTLIVVDDRADPEPPLRPEAGPGLEGIVRVIRGAAAGPAAARNRGWRQATAEWVVFLDDDVVPDGDWAVRLADDLAHAGPDVGGIQGRIVVPLPRDRRPTDWERNVKGLERARWATADMAYRRAALVRVGGFDERFPRAYREDSDLALRVLASGSRLLRGRRTIRHPVRPADGWVSLRLQAGNADDVLMRALHGPRWRVLAGAERGRLRRHVATTVAAGIGAAGLLLRRRLLAGAGLAGWVAGTAELAWSRFAPGPSSPDEVARIMLTSAAMPPVATRQWLLGWFRLPGLLRDRARAPRPGIAARVAVLFDRDGTLVVDVPYNGDPDRVVPVPGARRALDRLRSAGIPAAVISNQSAVGRGLITPEQLGAVNRRVEALLGPLGPWVFCPHRPDEGCPCRKPAPGMVLEAAARLAISPDRCVVIGDTAADVEAATAAGARAILVPTGVTRPDEVDAAPVVACDIEEAVNLVLEGAGR